MGDSANPCDKIPDDVKKTAVDNWCYTNVDMVNFNYLWTISNFSHCEEKIGETIKSPVFSSKNNDREKWCLRINPRGHDEESQNYISVYLLLVSCNKPEIKTHFSFSLVNNAGEVVKVMTSRRAYKFVYGKDWGFKKFIKRDFLLDRDNDILEDDKLTIFCEISTISEPVSLYGIHDEIRFTMPKNTLEDDYEEIFSTNKFTDATLTAKGREFHVHKAILAARSPVFSAMFEHQMEEGQLSQVKIIDVDSAVLCELLRFIYSGKVKNLEKMAFDLLAAADKYDVKRLKVMCEEALYKNLSVENAVDILILADLHSAEQLKSIVIEFICNHAKTIIKSEGWKSLIKSHPHLISEAYSFLASHKIFSAPPLCKKIKRQ